MEKHTVSRIPDALGLPSNRTGFPPIYFEIFLSSGSRELFQVDAAARIQREKRCVRVIPGGLERPAYPARTPPEGSPIAYRLGCYQRDSHPCHFCPEGENRDKLS